MHGAPSGCALFIFRNGLEISRTCKLRVVRREVWAPIHLAYYLTRHPDDELLVPNFIVLVLEKPSYG